MTSRLSVSDFRFPILPPLKCGVRQGYRQPNIDPSILWQARKPTFSHRRYRPVYDPSLTPTLEFRRPDERVIVRRLSKSAPDYSRQCEIDNPNLGLSFNKKKWHLRQCLHASVPPCPQICHKMPLYWHLSRHKIGSPHNYSSKPDSGEDLIM